MKYTAAYFDEPIDRLGTACEKWDGLWEDEKEGLLPMWVADMDIRCAPEIVQAIVNRAKHPVYGYTYQRDSAVDAMLAYLKRHQGLELTREQQATIPCVITGLKASIVALTKPDDAVLIQPPVYGPFFSSAEINGRRIVRNPLVRDAHGRYQINFEQLEEQLKAGVKLMMICSPHNPVGRAWSRQELKQTLALCKQYGTALVADEIHSGFVYEKDAFTSVLSLDETEDAQIVVLSSATKTFNIAGLRQAVLLTRNQAVKAAIIKAMDQVGALGDNIFALEATEAAYRYGDAWLAGLMQYLDTARGIVQREMTARLPQAIVSPIDATYMAWIDLRSYGMSTKQLMKATYDEGVALTEGTFFDQELGDGFLRFNFACPHSQTMQALEMLEKAVKKHKR